jgi:hypothetical protein
MGKQARQIKRLRRRLSQAKKGERRGRKKDERLKKLQGQLEKMRAQLAKAQGQLANARGHLANARGQLKKTRERLEEKNREVTKLRERLAALSHGAVGSARPEGIIWIFGTGRSGTTWLAAMMGDITSARHWNEPLVGALFGNFYVDRRGDKRGKGFILSPEHRRVWLSNIRSMVLDGAASRYPRDLETLVIKEPHGANGASLLSEAIPESRMIMLVRDPRDVVASVMDGHRPGGWTKERIGSQRGDWSAMLVSENPDAFVEQRAWTYLHDISRAKEAFDQHQGPKVLMKYEALRADALGEMRRACLELGIEVDEEKLALAVHKHSWENIPEEEKGEGKFKRKAEPGSWAEDLTPKQVEIVERTTASVLEEFYG